MFRLFKSFFKPDPKPPDIVVIHHSYFRGWPRSPSIQLQTFPLSVKVSLTPMPTALPINSVEYLFLESDNIAGMQRATYLLTDADFNKNAPDFIWVFLI